MAFQEEMNILVTLDKNYILPLRVMIRSILRTNEQALIHLYVAHSSLTEEDFAKIADGVSPTHCVIHPVFVSPDLLCDAPVLKRLTKASYYRLIAADYLPEDLDRVLYLDPDITVIRSLSEFYNMDLQGNYMAAAGHFDGFLRWLNRTRLGIRHNSDYINSGVLLMDLQKLRALHNTHEIFEYVRKNAKKLLLGDQDTVNAFYDGHLLILDTLKYNLDEKTFLKHKKRGTIDEQWVRENAFLIHYDGKHKPWYDGYEGALQEHFDLCRAELESMVGEIV